jgi:ATP-dependent RNA helicase RhlB
MPVSILKKVRNLVKKDPAASKEASKTAPKPAEAPPKKKSAPQPAKQAASDDHTPEPLEQAKKVRAAEPEVWKPGTPGEKKSQGERKENRNGDRPRRSRNRNSQRRSSSEKEGGEKRPSTNSAERKPREGERKPREGGQRRRSRSGEGRSRSGGDRRRNDSAGSTRGKGFSFPRPKPDAGDWKVEDYKVDAEEGKLRFADLGLADELLHAIADNGYQYCTPIQGEILPDLVKGRDGMGQAQTGTGKTAAFLLASLNHLLKNPKPDHPNGSPRMLILAPTRELVLQIEEEAAELMKYTNLQSLPVYGGLDYEPQKEALRHHQVDVVAATPGRLIDFMRSKVVDLSKVEILVLDEADRMLDMGFIPDVKRIVYATPHKDKRQTLFFSATFTDDIRRLAKSWTKDPISIVIEPENVAADTVDQTVYIVTDDQKFALTVNLLRKLKPNRTLIFSNRRDTSQDLVDKLKAYEFKVALLSGAVPQGKRVKTLEAFRDGSMPIVVATDVAGRGIHVDDVGLVINYNLPEDPEDYVHRIGRTGRAGEEGRSVCFASEMDSMMLPDIEKYIGRELKCTRPEDEWLEVEKREIPKRQRRSGGRGRPGGNRGRGGPRGGSRGGGGRGGRR